MKTHIINAGDNHYTHCGLVIKDMNRTLPTISYDEISCYKEDVCIICIDIPTSKVSNLSKTNSDGVRVVEAINESICKVKRFENRRARHLQKDLEKLLVGKTIRIRPNILYTVATGIVTNVVVTLLSSAEISYRITVTLDTDAQFDIDKEMWFKDFEIIR